VGCLYFAALIFYPAKAVRSHFDLNQSSPGQQRDYRRVRARVTSMSKDVARLRSRLKELETYQVLLKSSRAELEVLFLKNRLVEDQLKWEVNCRYTRELKMFGCSNL